MMVRSSCLVAALSACALAFPGAAGADPSLPGESGHDEATHDHPPVSPAAPDGAFNIETLAQNNLGVEDTTNSDLAFLDRVRLHASLTILAKLATALARARAVPLAA